jgi:hypothetical protein
MRYKTWQAQVKVLIKFPILWIAGMLIPVSLDHAKAQSTEVPYVIQQELLIEWQRKPTEIFKNNRKKTMQTELWIKLPGGNSFRETIPTDPYNAKLIAESKYPNAELITILNSK